MTTLSLTDARNGLTDAVNKVYYGRERVAIRRRNKDVAVLVPVEDAQFLQDLDRHDLAVIKKRMAEPNVPWEEIQKELGLRSTRTITRTRRR